jgi:iron(III) transport system permease protein
MNVHGNADQDQLPVPAPRPEALRRPVMTSTNNNLRAPGWFSRSNRTRAPVAILTVLLGLLTIPPLWYLIEGSLRTTTVTGAPGDFTLVHYARLIQDRQFFSSLGNSLVFAAGSAVLALILGGLVAWLVERTNAPFKAFAYLTAIISLGTPYVLYVIAWLFLFGRNGPLNEFLLATTGLQFEIYSMAGMILVEGFLWSPLAFLLLSSVFQAANADYEEAARMCGASTLHTIMRISLRLAMPGFLAVALLIVVRSIEAFEVPALVGLPGNVKVLTTDIYLDIRQTVPPNFGYASAFSVVLLGLAAVLITFYAQASRNAARYHTVTGRGFRPRAFDLGRARPLGGVVILTNFVLILGVPNAGLLWLSLMPFSQTFSREGLGLITLDNYRTVFRSSGYLELVWQTLAISVGAASAVMALTVVAAWLAVRRRPGAFLLDHLATIPLIFPGIVLGVAMIQIFLAAPVPIYGTLAAFIFAFTVRYLPYGMRYASSGVLQIHPELEEAASIAGGSFWLVLSRIIVPLTAPAILAGWLFIFLVAARDLSLAVILASPSAQPVAVAMFDLWANGQGTELAAFGLVWTALMTVIAAGFYILGRRSTAVAIRA